MVDAEAAANGGQLSAPSGQRDGAARAAPPVTLDSIDTKLTSFHDELEKYSTDIGVALADIKELKDRCNVGEQSTGLLYDVVKTLVSSPSPTRDGDVSGASRFTLPPPPSRDLTGPGSLSTKDVLASLDTFSGSTDKKSEVVDPDEFLHFNQWFATAKWKLFAAGIPVARHVSLICQKLSGPVVKAFMSRCEVEGWDISSPSFSVDLLHERLASLFHDAVITLRLSKFELTLVIIVCKRIYTSPCPKPTRMQIRMFCPSSRACVCEMDTPRTLSESPPRFNPDLAHFDFCFIRCKPLRLDVRLFTMSQRCSIEHDKHDRDAPEQASPHPIESDAVARRTHPHRDRCSTRSTLAMRLRPIAHRWGTCARAWLARVSRTIPMLRAANPRRLRAYTAHSILGI